jgi:beta-lactam-binding protein with PASTA domain
LKKFFTKQLLYNLLLALGILLVLLFLVSWGLRVYTRHGQSLTVPDLKGKVYKEAADILDDNNLDYVILDSSFVTGMPPMAVVEQNPKAGSKVKSGRTIYLTVNATNAPTTELPDLVGKSSFKYAKMQLESFGLQVAEPIYKPDPHQYAVLDMLVAGKSVSKNMRVPKGTLVTLVIGDGLNSSKINVPYLIGLKYEEALFKLKGEYQLNTGALIIDDGLTDTLSGIIYKQSPSYGDGNKIRLGEEIDLWIAKELPEGIEVHPEYYNAVQDSVEEP